MAGIIPGPTGDAITGFDAALDALEIALAILAESPIPLLDVIALIVDIILEILPFFAGKPRELSTLTVAQRLMHSQNFAVGLLGAEFMRLLRDENIVLSSSDHASQEKLGWSRVQAYTNLVNQGLDHAKAKSLIDGVILQTSSATQPLPKELHQRMDSKQHLWGSQRVLDHYNAQYNKWLQQGKTIEEATKKAMRWLYNNENIHDLWYIQTKQDKPTKLPPWNKNPPVPKEPAPQAGECTDPCLGGVIGAMNSLLATVTLISTTITKESGDAATQWKLCCDELMQRLDAITKALEGKGGSPDATDLKPLIDELEKIRAGARDTSIDEMIKTAISDGLIDPQLGQLAGT